MFGNRKTRGRGDEGRVLRRLCQFVDGCQRANENRVPRLAFESPCIPDLSGPPGCSPNRFYAYGVVARLAQLAAAIEVEELAAAEEAVPA